MDPQYGHDESMTAAADLMVSPDLGGELLPAEKAEEEKAEEAKAANNAAVRERMRKSRKRKKAEQEEADADAEQGNQSAGNDVEMQDSGTSTPPLSDDEIAEKLLQDFKDMQKRIGKKTQMSHMSLLYGSLCGNESYVPSLPVILLEHFLYDENCIGTEKKLPWTYK